MLSDQLIATAKDIEVHDHAITFARTVLEEARSHVNQGSPNPQLTEAVLGAASATLEFFKTNRLCAPRQIFNVLEDDTEASDE